MSLKLFTYQDFVPQSYKMAFFVHSFDLMYYLLLFIMNCMLIEEVLPTNTYLFHTYTHTTLNKDVLQIIFHGIYNVVECIMKMVYPLHHFYSHSCMYRNIYKY